MLYLQNLPRNFSDFFSIHLSSSLLLVPFIPWVTLNTHTLCFVKGIISEAYLIDDVSERAFFLELLNNKYFAIIKLDSINWKQAVILERENELMEMENGVLVTSRL